MKLHREQYEMFSMTSDSGADSMPTTKLEQTGQVPTDGNRQGDMAEFYAVTFLWDEGYEVFLNAGCTGPVDLIALKGDEVRLIDVKSVGEKTQGGKVLTDLQKVMGVELLYFDYVTRKLSWDRLDIKAIQKERLNETTG